MIPRFMLFPRKLPELNVGSRRRSSKEFHEVGPATDKCLKSRLNRG